VPASGMPTPKTSKRSIFTVIGVSPRVVGYLNTARG
jgi:hypothetical protein